MNEPTNKFIFVTPPKGGFKNKFVSKYHPYFTPVSVSDNVANSRCIFSEIALLEKWIRSKCAKNTQKKSNPARKVQFWSFCAIEEIIVRLEYGLKNCNVYWLLPEMDVGTGLRIVDLDAETIVMKQIAYKVSKFVLYLDIHNSFDDKAWEDIVVNPISTLPKVLSPRKTTQRHDDDGNNISDNDGSTDGDFVDSDYEIDVEDDDLFWDNVDDGVVDQGAALDIVISKGYKRNAPYGKENMQPNRQWDELSSDEDELELPSSDDEGQVGANLKTFMQEDIQNPIFKIGMKFASIEQLRKAITEYSSKHRVEIKKPINDKKRIKAHCDEKCPWNLYASFDSRMKCILIKSYVGDHTCQKKWELKKCTAKWLANKYLDKFRADEKMSLTHFGKTVQLELNLTMSRSKLSRERRMAWNIIYGDEVKQFNELKNYGHELRRTSPGTTFFLKCLDGLFSSLYVSLDASKRGFLAGCRPVICLDGYHIKTKFGGQLLTAIGIDPNDCIYLVAMAVVEVECLPSWKWFLETVKQDLGIENIAPWTIMIDKQKGLIHTVQQIFPDAEHRFCVRHLYSNILGKFKGENLKNQLWRCARASTVVRWNQEMEKMKVLNKDAHAWLEKMPPNTWVRAFFSEYPKCDILLNNTCEVFNNYILEARELPILSMLQRIKV
jgi:hypothetical protein